MHRGFLSGGDLVVLQHVDVESMELAAEPGLLLTVYTAPAGTAAADGLVLLASWAAGQEGLATGGQALS